MCRYACAYLRFRITKPVAWFYVLNVAFSLPEARRSYTFFLNFVSTLSACLFGRNSYAGSFIRWNSDKLYPDVFCTLCLRSRLIKYANLRMRQLRDFSFSVLLLDHKNVLWRCTSRLCWQTEWIIWFFSFSYGMLCKNFYRNLLIAHAYLSL